MSIVLRYDLIGVFKMGIKHHPQEHMRILGYNFTNSEPEPIGDCWFFEVPSIIEPLPKYLEESKYKFEMNC